MRRRNAERAWAAVLPLLIGPYLGWKHSRAIPRLEIESDIVWVIPVLGLKGFYDDMS